MVEILIDYRQVNVYEIEIAANRFCNIGRLVGYFALLAIKTGRRIQKF